jgi:hypothetical protein
VVEQFSKIIGRSCKTHALRNETRVRDTWIIFAIDGMREAARQRVLPKTGSLPLPFRRLDTVCPWLHEAQAGRGRPNVHGDFSGSGQTSTQHCPKCCASGICDQAEQRGEFGEDSG